MAGRREATRQAVENVAGLDTIRFLAALCVVLGHGASFPLAAYIPEKVGMWRVLMGLNSSLFNGVAAVLVFFVVQLCYSLSQSICFFGWDGRLHTSNTPAPLEVSSGREAGAIPCP